MPVLFDSGTPRGLAAFLTGHTVEEARLHGWEELSNGDLIAAAETKGFEVLVTTDKNISRPPCDFIERPHRLMGRIERCPAGDPNASRSGPACHIQNPVPSKPRNSIPLNGSEL